MSQQDFHDLGRLFGFREALAAVEAAPVPAAVLVAGPHRIEGGRVGILPGSFNPPTLAHTDLAGAARRRFDLDHVVYSLSSVIVDKERVEGLCREDRLLLLSLLACAHPWAAVAVVNRGLYSEQAPAFRASFGRAAELWVIVGMDKVLQIFDGKYYDDRDRALDGLFAQARLVAANRGEWGAGELYALLERPGNAPYRDRVQPLALAAGLRDHSSTAIRHGVGEGSPGEDALAETVRAFIAATAAFREPYDLRVAAIDALYPVRQWARTEVPLATLLARAAEPGEAGEGVRELLRRPMAPELLMARLRSLGVTRSGT